MAYSNDYTQLLKRLKKGERIKVRFSYNKHIKGKWIDKTYYGYMYEDDYRYFITSYSAGLQHYEPCLARNKYTANLHEEFARIKIEFKRAIAIKK